MAVVTARVKGGTRVDISARGLRWTGDEPPPAGGNAGPTPYELLLGSLAACIGVTLRLYATHKGIALDGVDVRLEFDRVHADDCSDCDERADGWVDRVRSDVVIHGTFTDGQRARLEQIAKRCPVHKTLTNGVHVTDVVTCADQTPG